MKNVNVSNSVLIYLDLQRLNGKIPHEIFRVSFEKADKADGDSGGEKTSSTWPCFESL
jgi:hypothetical protein